MVQLVAYGASGGNGQFDSRYRGGFGAMVRSSFVMQPGDKLNVVIGQPGDHREASSGSSHGGGGGGGTFVWRDGHDSPLLVAGGGGGASYASTSQTYWGQHGRACQAGSDAKPTGGSGGLSGMGGQGSVTTSTCKKKKERKRKKKRR